MTPETAADIAARLAIVAEQLATITSRLQETARQNTTVADPVEQVRPSKTLGLAEVAEALSFPQGKTGTAGKQRVYRMVQAGQLAAIKCGREFRVTRDELDRFLASAGAA